MVKNTLYILFISFFGILGLGAQPRVLLLDVGGLFYKYSSLAYACELGLGSIIEYTFLDCKNPKGLEQVIFKVLHEVAQEDIVRHADEFKHSQLYKTLQAQGKEGTAPLIITTKMSSGRDLPYLISAFQAGHISSKIAKKLALEAYDRLKKKGCFTSEREARIVEKALNMLFTPELGVTMNKELPDGVALLKELVEKAGLNGEQQLLVAFSNVDKESAYLLEQRFKTTIFDRFAYRFYSGDLGTVKPNKEAFRLVIDALNEKEEFKEKPLGVDEIIFMDDQAENIDAAKQVGITHTILYKNARQARKELIAYGIPGLEHKTSVSMVVAGALTLGALVTAAYVYCM